MRWLLSLFFVLLLSSVVLVLWQRHGMITELDILAMDNLQVVTLDDRTNRGRSRARLVRNQQFTMDCELRDVAPWPYCQMQLKFAPMGDGLDLTRFDYVKITLDVTGEGDPGVRLYLPNFEQGISNLSDSSLLKVNEVEFFINQDGSEHRIPLNMFHVAGWWRADKRVPLMKSGVNIDNVAEIHISTGSLMREGQFQYRLLELRFEGKLIQDSTLYFSLMLAWILFGLGLLIQRWWLVSRQLDDSQHKSSKLEKLTHSLKSQTKELSQQARTDALTKLSNRAAFHQDMSETLKHPVCIFVIDLDHFKQLNDQHGHMVGDEVLVHFAQLMLQAKRQQDWLYRWGGEEFVLICQETQLTDAHLIAQKLLEQCRHNPWPKQVQQRCSIGVAGTRQDEDWQLAFERADKALYQAKSAGRDCAVINFHGKEVKL